ncbi:unnamed protein product [Cuscuta campestris]|uniref:Uncharacterized protein n=1 Tax=Cuscuta campestris TaxID=132261 RepID=A0A484NCD5_9ASTE|nr:unnamed protein product [Cuscuta campestris]
MWRPSCSMLMKLVLILSLSVVRGALCHGNFQAFYFVQQWLGSYCNQRGTRCCYPPTGKPTPDFTIYGLWPYNSDGSFPDNCPGDSFNVAPLKAMEDSLQKAWPSFTCPLIGRKFWLHEWNKYGTCSMSAVPELHYFESAIDLKNKINILQALAKAGIRPNNRFYPLKSIKKAVESAFGFHPWVNCNHNANEESQIWQITLCVDRSGKKLVDCPFIPKGRIECATEVFFPSYY